MGVREQGGEEDTGAYGGGSVRRKTA